MLNKIQLNWPIIFIIISGIFISCINNTQLHAQALITESKVTFRTYPFSDPSPIPLMNNVYPYYKFDGYSSKSLNQEWTIVTLENPYIKVLVAPQIGGKVLGAFEKSTGLPFIYYNKVIKFREIAMRGPWTSGGIEFNFGDIGHTPTTSSPVDYLLQKNNDGSVSCFIGALDLPSRTEWRIEIRLAPDKSYFETNSYWFNPTPYNTSLYNWSNAAVAVGEDLKYYFPGSNYIGHDGVSSEWPILKSGRNISYYKNNDYGEDHSYHVLGEYTDFFAGIWEKSNFGFGHWSLYSDKPGRKIWIWALSRQGQIWESLLTDPELGNVQYTEIQSGLLFNQAASNSSNTPFKHVFFAPYNDQRFSEIWFPIKGMNSVVDANKYGSLDVQTGEGFLKFILCANQKINDNIIVTQNGRTIYNQNIALKPVEVFSDSININSLYQINVVLGDNLLSYQINVNKQLQRPLLPNADFNWESTEGIFTDGLEKARQRDYSGALQSFLKCLEKDPDHTQSLIRSAEIYSRQMEYTTALDYLYRALANDTYNPDANFLYGIINRKLNKLYDAIDGFSISSQTLAYRSASYTQLAEIFFLKKEYDKSLEYAQRALDYNKYNKDAYKILAIVYRHKNDESRHRIIDKLLEIDPLNHFALFEKYIDDKKLETLNKFKLLIRNELPFETYLELASYYLKLGLYSDALIVLNNSPSHPMVNLWIAYLYEKDGRSDESLKFLKSAIESSPYLVFPFREETATMLEWAENIITDWKLKYYMGLIVWNRGKIIDAKKYFNECGTQPDYSPFYMTRIILNQYGDSLQTIKDFQKALQLNPKDWRAYHLIGKYYNNKGMYKEALAISSKAIKYFPNNYIIEFDYATSLLYNYQYEKCISKLEKINILPFEGAGYGHEVYRSALILWALREYKKGRYQNTIDLVERATLWPENLGAGKPFSVDTRIEDFIKGMCYKQMKNTRVAQEYFIKIFEDTKNNSNLYNSKLLLGSIATKEIGGDGIEILNKWFNAHPNSLIAKWAIASYENNKVNKNEIITVQDYEWNPFPKDPDFKLVYEVIKTIKK